MMGQVADLLYSAQCPLVIAPYIFLKGMDLDASPAKLPSPAGGRGAGGEGGKAFHLRSYDHTLENEGDPVAKIKWE